MRVDRITPPTQPGKPWQLSLEGGSLLQVSESAMIDFALHTGMELSPEQLLALEQAHTLAALRDKAISLLVLRPYSKGELKKRLSGSKGVAPEALQEVVDWVQSIGLLDEAGYAQRIVRSYGQKGYGLYRIREELYRRQIPKELWEDALEELEDPAQQIDQYLERHLKSLEPKAVKKAADALARRGFSWSEVSSGIRRFGVMEDE